MTTPSSNTPIRLLAISTYELGQQPLVLARIAAILNSAGIEYSLCDNSVDKRTFTRLEDFLLEDQMPPTHLIISVPMHTATQLARAIADRARRLFGDSITIIALGLYSKVALASSSSFDQAVASGNRGEILSAIGVDPQSTTQKNETNLIPDRSKLPGLANYAHLIEGVEQKVVGYVESTIGCAHECLHCPVPVVFGGRFKAVPLQTVLAQINELYQNGARHITFGDPDFLNGPMHALRIARAMNAAHPDLTFDATVKVEHVLENRWIWDELSTLGLKFIVSAFEHTSDEILKRLGKGHTRSDILEALSLLRQKGIEVRPSLMPFTPWTTRENLLDLVEFLFENQLVNSVDPVQLTIRLLVPLGSLVLGEADIEFGPWNPEALSYEWHSSDPAIDDLQQKLASIAEDAECDDLDPFTVFSLMREAIYRRFNMPAPPHRSIPTCESKPRLTESWFCCAEPTKSQTNQLGSPSEVGCQGQ